MLSAHRSGRLDDTIDILSLLGRDVVRTVAQARLSTFAPDGSNDDYWYALIRAAGRTGDREIPGRFLESRFIALEEAAVQALGDIGDSTALKELRRVANDPRRSQLIREARRRVGIGFSLSPQVPLGEHRERFRYPHKTRIDPPCYVRKVDRPTSCGAKEDHPERRAALIEENVLSEDGGVLSLLYVTHSTDVIRAAMALNWCRTGGTRVEGLCLLAFTLDELEGVAKDQTTDSFACHWARQNHWNITLAIPDRGRVANVLANRNRFPKNFTRSKMKERLCRGARRWLPLDRFGLQQLHM